MYAFTDNYSICDGTIYNWHNINYTLAGTYYASYTSISACDSVYTLHLNVNHVNTGFSVSNITLTVDSIADSYEWVDCDNSFAPINGANNQNYTATTNGNYAVIITQGVCSDTSACYVILTVGIDSVGNNKTIKIYPNPVTNELIIEISGNTSPLGFEILNSIGQIIFKGSVVEKTIVPTKDFSAGMYLIKIENGKTFEFKKVIKE